MFWRLVALIVAASVLLLFVAALNIAGAATSPPQGNVVPNFSGLKVSGPTEVIGSISNPNTSGDSSVKIDDDLRVTKSADISGKSYFRDDIYIGSGKKELTISGYSSFGINFDTPVYFKKLVSALANVIVSGNLYVSNIAEGSANAGINILDSINIDPNKILNVTYLRGGLIGAVQPLKIMSDIAATKDFDVNGVIKNSTAGGVVKVSGGLDVSGDAVVRGPFTVESGGLYANGGASIFGNMYVSKQADGSGGMFTAGGDVKILGKLLNQDGTSYVDLKEAVSGSKIVKSADTYGEAVASCPAGYKILSCYGYAGDPGKYLGNSSTIDACTAYASNPNKQLFAVFAYGQCLKISNN